MSKGKFTIKKIRRLSLASYLIGISCVFISTGGLFFSVLMKQKKIEELQSQVLDLQNQSVSVPKDKNASTNSITDSLLVKVLTSGKYISVDSNTIKQSPQIKIQGIPLYSTNWEVNIDVQIQPDVTSTPVQRDIVSLLTGGGLNIFSPQQADTIKLWGNVPSPVKIVDRKLFVNAIIKDLYDQPLLRIINNKIFYYSISKSFKIFRTSNAFIVVDAYESLPFILESTNHNPIVYQGYLTNENDKYFYAFNGDRRKSISINDSYDKRQEIINQVGLNLQYYLNSRQVTDDNNRNNVKSF